MNNSLIVFLRKPVIGKVKSRLSKEVGATKALKIYNWLLEITFLAFKKLNHPVNLYFDQKEGETPYWSGNFLSHIQKGEELGSRMANALNEQLKISGKTIMIGSDCPEINEKTIIDGFEALDENDLVFGPAKDGGIYLIGMKKYNKELFNNVPWSSPEVLNKLKENATNLSMKFTLLKEMQDIDYYSDFVGWEADFDKFEEFKKDVVKKAS